MHGREVTKGSIDGLHERIDNSKGFIDDMLHEILQELSSILSHAMEMDVTPPMIKGRLSIMKTRFKLFNEFYKSHGIKFKLNRNKSSQIDMMFMKLGFEHYNDMGFCFSITPHR